jgi:pyruvate formate lyase activating enzyme
MKEAMFWKRSGNKIRCELCPHFCLLGEGEVGRCRVRKNTGGKLISLNYGGLVSLNPDPIEKKPLFHFLPGQEALSIATSSCNFKCKNCQNWEISQSKPEDIRSLEMNPKDVVERAEGNTSIIAYTYTEPTIFYEFMFKTAKLAKKEGINNVMISNGFINKSPLKKLIPYLDGVNIDLKSINNQFYREVCRGRLEPVLETLELLKKNKIWLEITNLLIPGLNDSKKDVEKMVGRIRKLDKSIPLHFSGFYPTYKMKNLPPTKESKMRESEKIAKRKLDFVYGRDNNTYCPDCGKVLIKRKLFGVVENNLKNGKCSCGRSIPGVWS